MGRGSGVSLRGRGHGCAMAGGEKVSAPVVTRSRESKRARGERGSTRELTAVAAETTASSEEARSERGGEGDLGDPRKKKASGAALRGVRHCVAQRGGRGRSGG